jgi:hypothetical protein
VIVTDHPLDSLVPPTAGSQAAGAGAGAWCALFAGLHVYWASGGNLGLASSAGHDLASRRPAAFVVFGLWGVATVLVTGAVLAMIAGGRALSIRWLRVFRALMALVAAGLLLRGGYVELALATNLGGVRQAVGPLETHWSLVLWNPWFLLGGASFGVLAVAVHRRLSPARARQPAAPA